MKLIFFLILTFTTQALFSANNVQVSKLKEIELDDTELDYSTIANLERDLKNAKKEILFNLELLLQAKYKIINGDLKGAERYLLKIDSQSPYFSNVKRKYLSIIYFINERYDDSLKNLDFSKTNSEYSKICTLRFFNLMALNKLDKLPEEFQNCSASTERYSINDHFWLRVLYYLKTHDAVNLNKVLITEVETTLHDDEMSRVWLKAGLFLNKEKDVINVLNILPDNSFFSKKIREIVAFMYFRENKSDMALKFIDDIDTANAENIKGNIYLQKNQYELAYGHFKLAISKKDNSENSLERSIPLAFELNQYEDGLAFLNKINFSKIDKKNINATRIAFLIKMHKLNEAQKEIEDLKKLFKTNLPIEIVAMENYINLTLSKYYGQIKFDMRKLETDTEKACQLNDGINCWVSLSHMHWNNLGKTVKRSDKIYSNPELEIENLKLKKEIVPLEEPKILDQRDIEELDSNSIDLKSNLDNIIK